MIKILLVEDNLISQKMMYYTFRTANLTSDLASDGEEAVAKAAGERYDVILMDIMMPGIDGYEATLQIRKAEQTSGHSAFIIGLTGNVYDSERHKCLDAGMNAYMPKPFDIDLFKSILSKSGVAQF